MSLRIIFNKSISQLSALLLLVVALLLSSAKVSALELTVTNNGSSSNNEVNISSSNNTQVSQSNNSQVNSSVVTSANTGGNISSGNTGGDASVTTGNINTKTNVSNSGNVSAVEIGCCPKSAGTNLTISANGSGSDNGISANLSSQTQISVNQVISINNKILTNVNTGSNRADNNVGAVSIDTGNITINSQLINQDINLSRVKAPPGSFFDLMAKISGDGSNSDNTIDVTLQNRFDIMIQNLAKIDNVVSTNAQTGENSTSDNDGNVSIAIGDVSVNTNIENANINAISVSVNCCNEENKPNPQPGPGPIGPAGSSASSGSPGASSDGGGVLAALQPAGQILPVTGSLWIILMTLASVLMFVLGLYLRLHPGQDPGKNYAYA